MPLLDNITITLPDMQNIMEACQQEGYNGTIKIIDAGAWYTVRDSDDMSIKDIRKVPRDPEEQT